MGTVREGEDRVKSKLNQLEAGSVCSPLGKRKMVLVGQDDNNGDEERRTRHLLCGHTYWFVIGRT